MRSMINMTVAVQVLLLMLMIESVLLINAAIGCNCRERYDGNNDTGGCVVCATNRTCGVPAKYDVVIILQMQIILHFKILETYILGTVFLIFLI